MKFPQFSAVALLLAAGFAQADPPARLVVVGDSLSAGFQNFSLYHLPPSGQTAGFASLVATQAKLDLTLPLISYPGIPPALRLIPGGIIREQGIGQRENPQTRATNLSVPGFSMSDAISHPFPGDPTNAIDALSDVILGLPPGVPPGCGPLPAGVNKYVVSQIVCAVALRPTLMLVSLGNNDALQALTFGIPPTDPAKFGTQLSVVMATLAASGASIFVANIPDVTVVPFLVPVGGFYQQCGFLPQGATFSDYVVPNILDPTKPVELCTNYAVRPAALIQQAKAAVVAYNAKISSVASIFRANVVDVNGLFNRIAQQGYDVNGRHLTTAFLGGLFSLDGIHPTNTGYAILANEWIKTMNKKGPKIPPVSVEQVAATDPLILP